MGSPSWNSAKHLLAEYDGVATEIFVINLPRSRLSAVMTVLSELPTLEVISFGDAPLEHPEPFDPKWRVRFESIPSRNCQYALRSANGTPRHLQIYLWVDANASMIEVEFVFWNDLTFPQNLASEECEKRLKALVSLAEACRKGVPDAKCVLTPEHNGPTEELLEKRNEFMLVW